MLQLWRIFSVGLLVSLLAFSSGTLTFGADARVPVKIGSDGGGEFDASMSIGEVTALNPKGDGFLAVRSGPGVSYTQLDKLRESENVYLCSLSRDKKWWGVVYSNSKSVSIYDCGVSSPVSSPRPYGGKCQSGWVRAKWIRVVAG